MLQWGNIIDKKIILFVNAATAKFNMQASIGPTESPIARPSRQREEGYILTSETSKAQIIINSQLSNCSRICQHPEQNCEEEWSMKNVKLNYTTL